MNQVEVCGKGCLVVRSWSGIAKLRRTGRAFLGIRRTFLVSLFVSGRGSVGSLGNPVFAKPERIIRLTADSRFADNYIDD